jgi:hypothetical protein
MNLSRNRLIADRQTPLSAGAVLILALAALLLGGCATYRDVYRFTPAPVRVQMPKDAPAAEAVQTLVSVVGVRYPGRPKGAPASVDLRVKVINRSDQLARLLPEQMELVSAGLDDLANPTTEPPGPLTVDPGQSRTLLAKFPLPKDADHRLNGLNLQWVVQLGEQRYTRDVTFRRRPEPRPTYIRTGFGVGYWHLD